MKAIFIRLLFKFLKSIFSLSYSKVDLAALSPIYLFKIAFFQKILGFNRHVFWPVHWTSEIVSVKNIIRGNRFPGLSVGCYLDGRNGIEFGKNVWVGPFVKIISMNHSLTKYTEYVKVEKIVIKENCWIGANSIILPGVVLGEHTIVAAGSVVTKSFPETDQVIGGNPARVIKKIAKYQTE